jgi:Zn finger protein HypA/HybF involved in hydrogenase expression
MKIVEIKCRKCKSKYETLESVPRDAITCPACGGKDLDYKVTEREFKGCGGDCNDCQECK